MTQRLPYGDWLNLMADACGMDRGEFKRLNPKDRSELLSAASGMTYAAFKALPDSVSQAQAIRKHSGGKVEVKRAEGGKTDDEITAEVQPGEGEGEGEGQAEGEGQDGDGEGQEGEAEAEGQGEGSGEAEDPVVMLKGLRAFLEPVVGEMIEAKIAEGGFQSGQKERIEIKVKDLPTVEIEGHVHPQFEHVLKLAVLGLPIMLVGPAGTGKTTLAAMVAKAMGRSFGSLSCTAGMSEGEIVGKLLPDETGGFRYRTSQFVTLYENGGIFLFDEIDAADPNVLLKVNQSIGTVRGGGLWFNDLRQEKPQVQQHADFVLIAAANTFGTGAGAQYVGRNQLDAATLDRFEVVWIDYDRDYEAKVGDEAICKWLWDVRKKTVEAKLRRVVSTRAIERATMKLAAGFKMQEIKDDFFASWSKDERAKVEA
jgi:MoxR-like ATPase